MAKEVGIIIGLLLLVVGVILLAIGASGTTSYIQLGIGAFLAVVGALSILLAVKG